MESPRRRSVAHHREFQAAQDDRIKHYRSNAMINFHFRLAGTATTIDIRHGRIVLLRSEGRGGVGAARFYFNGNKSKWKDFLELPLIQPEKVLTLPLDITFDRSYAYEYVGEDTVDGHACHVLSFTPVDPTRALYRGRVWIDKASWARVRVDSVQTKVESPFLSNEEKTTYQPLTAPDGGEDWVISRIDGQQIYSTGGRSFIVLREITFSDFLMNDAGFEEARSSAYSLTTRCSGTRTRGSVISRRRRPGSARSRKRSTPGTLFALGAHSLRSEPPTIRSPARRQLLQLRRFRHRAADERVLRGSPAQPQRDAHPNIGGTGIELGSDVFLTALDRTDKQFVNGEEIEELNVKSLQQSISFNLGRQVGDFLKLRTTYDLTWQDYKEDDDTGQPLRPAQGHARADRRAERHCTPGRATRSWAKPPTRSATTSSSGVSRRTATA